MKLRQMIRKLILTLCNILYCNVITGLFVVVFWQSSWTILDLYLILESRIISLWIFVGVGLFLSASVTLFQERLKTYFDTHSKKCVFLLVSRTYTYITAWGYVLLWRGLWGILDTYTWITLSSGVTCIIVSITIMAILKTIRNFVAAPFVVDIDSERTAYFSVSTRFSFTMERPCLYSCDTAVTCFVVAPFVVVFWRGVWTTFDQLLPQDPSLTVLYSLTIFLTCQWIYLLLRYPFTIFFHWMNIDQGTIKSCIDAVKFCYLGATCVVGWRCIWNSITFYYLPAYPRLACWTAHAIGYLTLTANQVSNSLLLRGCKVDGDDSQSHGLLSTTIIFQQIWCSCTKSKDLDTQRSGHQNVSLQEYIAGNDNVVQVTTNVTSVV